MSIWSYYRLLLSLSIARNVSLEMVHVFCWRLSLRIWMFFESLVAMPDTTVSSRFNLQPFILSDEISIPSERNCETDELPRGRPSATNSASCKRWSTFSRSGIDWWVMLLWLRLMWSSLYAIDGSSLKTSSITPSVIPQSLRFIDVSSVISFKQL